MLASIIASGLAAGAIYALHRGKISTLFPGISIPNSICFSPDGSVGYFTDTARAVLYAVPLNPATGLPRGEPDVLLRHIGIGGLDGSVCDADGQIWNACWGAGRIDVYSPQGERLRSLSVPAKQSSCPAFVGPELSRLIVTSAWQDSDAAARAAALQSRCTLRMESSERGCAEPHVKLDLVSTG